MFYPLTPSTKAQVGRTLRFLRRKGTKMFKKNSPLYFVLKTLICVFFSTPVYVLGDWTQEDYYDLVVFANGMRIPLPIVCNWVVNSNWSWDKLSKTDRFQRILLKQSAKAVSSLPRFDSHCYAEEGTFVHCYQTLEQV